MTKISKPSKANILKIKNIKGKKLSIKLKKISNANGYQIIYATSSKMKGSKKTATTSVDKTIKKLQKGKTYYVKVRAYKLDSLKNKIYGSYSSIKKVKIKK